MNTLQNRGLPRTSDDAMVIAFSVLPSFLPSFLIPGAMMVISEASGLLQYPHAEDAYTRTFFFSLEYTHTVLQYQ